MSECRLQCDGCGARYELATRFFGCPVYQNSGKRRPLEVTGDHALRAIYESGGSMMVGSEEEILHASQRLQRKGLALESASALAFACAERAAELSPIDEVWVVIGSGAAVKWPDTLLQNYRVPSMGTTGINFSDTTR